MATVGTDNVRARVHALRTGPSHPLALAAAALLVLNDFVLKQAAPGFVTGKLSDLAWLLVAPVVLAALLSFAGLSHARARRGALGLVAAAYITLQLWAPLGDAWCALTLCTHLADPLDLIALPALALAPLVWRVPRASPTRQRRFKMPRVSLRAALPLTALACVASRSGFGTDERLPCDWQEDWDPNLPLYLEWSSDQRIPITGPEFLNGVSLTQADGTEVPLAFADKTGGEVLVCPIGGLLPSTEYAWQVGPFASKSTNQLSVPDFNLEGGRRFVTAESSSFQPIDSASACRSFDSMSAIRELSCRGDSGFFY